MASRLELGSDTTVLLRVTHSNIKTFSAEVRFDLEMSVEAAKEKLWKKCGTSVDHMLLELYDDASSKICDLTDNARPLGFYSPLDGYHIKIIDLDPSSISSGGWLEDTSLVKKYEISEEAYDKLDCNFRKFKERILSQNATTQEDILPENHMEELCKSIKVGDRCEVEPGEKRGTVMFVGKAENVAPGFWIGVQLDEPLGKHDGLKANVILNALHVMVFYLGQSKLRWEITQKGIHLMKRKYEPWIVVRDCDYQPPNNQQNARENYVGPAA